MSGSEGGAIMRSAPLIERFEDKYIPEPNSGCFIWTAGVSTTGYGRIAFNGRPWIASRIAWMLAHGDPGELFVLHKCDNRLCVNIDHLFLGTHHDNCMDAAIKGRTSRSKLSPENVRQIRDQLGSGQSKRSLGRQFGVNEKAIRALVEGRTWTHVV